MKNKMHTSTRIDATDFQYWRLTPAGCQPTTFAQIFPDYHELDRVGVVSPTLADGICHTGRALLALTTAFYDCHRARSALFFDYPQHFALVGADQAGVHTYDIARAPHTPALWDAWGWLDVWPANKWLTAAPTATALVERVFDYQINRLFWPLTLWPTPDEARLPDYAYKMLQTRLKAVYYYAPTTVLGNDLLNGLPNGLPNELPVVEVEGSPAAERLLQESLDRLPVAARGDPLANQPIATRFQLGQVSDFVTRLTRQP